MAPKRTAALAMACVVLALLAFAAVAGKGDDRGESAKRSRGEDSGRASGREAAATRRDAAEGTDTRRAAEASEAAPTGETTAGGTRSETEVPKEPEWSVYVMRVRGAPPRRLTHSESEVPENPDWSPLGDRIVFAGMSCEDCDAGVRIVGADGSRSRGLLTSVPSVADPSSSPSGRRFAVTRVGGVIYSIDSTTGAARRLTSDREASEGPAWSPKGRQIAYARQVSAANWDIYVMNADGDSKRAIIRGPRQELAPAWSPTGRRIAFQRQEKSGVWAIYTANADGSHERKVTFGRSSAEQPSWSPDGRKIAFVRVTVGGSRIVVVRLTGRRDQSEFVTPPSLQAAYPDWSPDGRIIAFTAKHLEHE